MKSQENLETNNLLARPNSPGGKTCICISRNECDDVIHGGTESSYETSGFTEELGIMSENSVRGKVSKMAYMGDSLPHTSLSLALRC